jgi:hypothetical protein
VHVRPLDAVDLIFRLLRRLAARDHIDGHGELVLLMLSDVVTVHHGLSGVKRTIHLGGEPAFNIGNAFSVGALFEDKI